MFLSRFVVVYVHVACTRAREATALLGHMLARQQVCGRGGACNGDIYKICTYRLLYKYVVDGVSLRHNPGGVGCGQLLLGVALVVFRFLSFPLLNSKSSSEADVGRTQAYQDTRLFGGRVLVSPG